MTRAPTINQPSNLLTIGETAHFLKSLAKTKPCFDWGDRSSGQIDGVIKAGIKAYCLNPEDSESRGRNKPLSNTEEYRLRAAVEEEINSGLPAGEDETEKKTDVYRIILSTAQILYSNQTSHWNQDSARNFSTRHGYDFTDRAFKKVLEKERPTSKAVLFSQVGEKMRSSGELGPLDGKTRFWGPFVEQAKKANEVRKSKNRSNDLSLCEFEEEILDDRVFVRVFNSADVSPMVSHQKNLYPSILRTARSQESLVAEVEHLLSGGALISERHMEAGDGSSLQPFFSGGVCVGSSLQPFFSGGVCVGSSLQPSFSGGVGGSSLQPFFSDGLLPTIPRQSDSQPILSSARDHSSLVVEVNCRLSEGTLFG